MADSQIAPAEEELSKKARLINAWLAVGSAAKATNIAEITGASTAYASRVKSDMDADEISDDAVANARDEALIEAYTTRYQQFTEHTDDAASTNEQAPTDTQPAADASDHHALQGDQQYGERDESTASQEASPPQQPGPHSPAQNATQHSSQAPQSPSQPPATLSTDGQQTIQAEQLRELDDLLATYEREARFDLRNLPSDQTAAAAGKLFVAQEARSNLRELVAGDTAASQ